MKRFVGGATLLWLAFVPGCTTPPEEGDDVPPPPPMEQPDAGIESCQADSCGTPSDPDCCEGSECVNFGEFGDISCAMTAAADDPSLCETGCVQELQDGTLICAPEEWCGIAGIYPETYCNKADSCDFWWKDEDDCVAYVESCLEPRSNSDELAWMQAIYTCTTDTSCSTFADCMYDLGFCW